MKWGNMCEQFGMATLVETILKDDPNIIACCTGLWKTNYKNGDFWLGIAPDGLVYNKYTKCATSCIEIKCPYRSGYPNYHRTIPSY